MQQIVGTVRPAATAGCAWPRNGKDPARDRVLPLGRHQGERTGGRWGYGRSQPIRRGYACAVDGIRIALAQVDPTVGDLDGNAALLAEAIGAAREQGADLVAAP